ncbi:ceramide synthase [Vairimorpha necatrix]|uniref:Ceramide synthase n=1 Tax=Vairimorpha necatrix TaxID=6039 RepID=A0AAX4JDA4_9MICR
MDRGEPAQIWYFPVLCASFVLCNIFIVLRSLIWKSVTNKVFQGNNNKAQACISKIFFYGFVSIYGYFVLNYEPWSKDTNQYHLTFGPETYPLKIYFYYIVEFSFYLTEFLYLLSSYDSKDRYQLIIHHIVTISLITLSFCKDYARVGIVVMGLHDVADPFLECSKLLVYMNNTLYANIGFAMFTAVFILSRIFFYPYWILYPTYQYLKKAYTLDAFLCACCLFILYILHWYWTFMILKTFRNIFVKKEYKDARSKSVINDK